MFKKIEKDAEGNIISVEIDRLYFEKILEDTNKNWYEVQNMKSLMSTAMWKLQNTVSKDDFNIDDYERELNEELYKESVKNKSEKLKYDRKRKIIGSIEEQIDNALDMIDDDKEIDVNVDVSRSEYKPQPVEIIEPIEMKEEPIEELEIEYRIDTDKADKLLGKDKK